MAGGIPLKEYYQRLLHWLPKSATTTKEADRAFVYKISLLNCRLVHALRTRPDSPPVKEMVMFGPEYIRLLHKQIILQYKDTEDPVALEGLILPSNLDWLCDQLVYYGNSRKSRRGRIIRKAAFLLYHITKGHPFADGNKRTALVTANSFLEWNGYTIATKLAKRPAAARDFMIEIAKGEDKSIDINACWHFIANRVERITKIKNTSVGEMLGKEKQEKISTFLNRP